MKSFFVQIVFLLTFQIVWGQQIVGGLRLPSREEIEHTKELKVKELKKDLPYRLDNSLQPYFRGVFIQANGSCAQASGVGYTFTYEINRVRNTNAKLPENQFPTHYTYNFLNDGSGANGSFYTDGWEIIRANGIPNVVDYGGLYINPQIWISGYEKYEHGFDNRVEDYFVIDVSTPEGLLTLKNYLANHLDGSPVGGIVNFAAGVTNEFTMYYDSVITEWGHQVNHAMTIVGWDDSVKFDYNLDGKYTNDKDINGDGIVDMRDWEKGALIMVNSWGENFGVNGKAYVMYRLLALPPEEGGIFANKVWGVNVREHYEPKLFMRVKITHPNRKHLIITAGVNTDLDANFPEHRLYLPVFYKQGGNLPLNGTDSTPIEISLDISPLLTYVDAQKPFNLFLIVKEFDAQNLYDGEILDFYVLDNQGNKFYPQINSAKIENNSETYLKVRIPGNFEKPQITTERLYDLTSENYSATISVEGGEPPVNFSLIFKYREKNKNYYPVNATKQLQPDNLDDGIAVLPLDFSFPFYGKLYDTLYVGTDGWIKLSPQFDYIRSDHSIIRQKVIGVFASDLQIFPSFNEGICYEKNSDSVVITWNTGLWNDSVSRVNVSAVLYKNGKMRFFYNSETDDVRLDTVDNNWACGISAGDRNNFLISSVSGLYPVSGKAVEIAPVLMPTGLTIDDNGHISGKIIADKNFWSLGVKIADNQWIGDYKEYTFGKSLTTDNNLLIYPNPARDFVAFNLQSDENQNALFTILNSEGKVVFSREIELVKGSNTIVRETNFADGVYFVQIYAKGKIYTGKFTIQKN